MSETMLIFINLSYGFTYYCFQWNFKKIHFDDWHLSRSLINYFPQFRARLGHFRQLDWLHVFYAIDALFSHVIRVVCAFHAQEQL